MLCGTRSFSHVDKDPSSPSLRRTSSYKKSKNPYSSRGLDKFSKVVSELEEKREKIMAARGAVPLVVRFMYNNTQDWIPIVVRLNEESSPPPKKKKTCKQASIKPKKIGTIKPLPLPAAQASQINQEIVGEPAVADVVKVEKAQKKKFCWSDVKKWRPSYYWPLVMLVVLSCLVFGRVFAVCCTSIWWYMVPIMKGEDEKMMSMKKRVSDKRLGGGGSLVAIPSFQNKKSGNGVLEVVSPRSK